MEEYLPICYLRPELKSSVSVVGVVIASEKPRQTEVKYATTPATKRYVFNFTIRDDREDTINAAVWGPIDYVSPLSEICRIGANVKIVNPRIRDFADGKEQSNFLPQVSSQYSLTLDEQANSTVKRFDCEDEDGYSLTARLESVFHIPLKSNCDKVTILELLRDNSYYSPGDFVNLLAVVVTVSPVMDFTSKEGKLCHRQEIKLMDPSVKDKFATLILWESALQTFASDWQPRSTVLYLSSVKLYLDRYANRKFLSAVSRSVITIDPQTDEGKQMNNYAKRGLPDAATLSNLFHQQQTPQKFTREEAKKLSSVAGLHQFAKKVLVGSCQQAVLKCFVTIFSLDTERIFQTKCVDCGRRCGRFSEVAGSPMCENASCRSKNTGIEIFFDFNISITDSSGMLTQIRVAGEFAENILGIKPEIFLTLSQNEREDLQNRFWMERCEIGVQVEHRPNGKRVLNALHLEPINID